jgi:cytosine/adenosine deaminase-related metal-dependent hydrolase
MLLKGAHVLTCDDKIGYLDEADILIEGETIVAIDRDIGATDSLVIDMKDRLILPGFVDSHRHLWEGLLRNSLPDADLGEYMYQVLGIFGKCFEPEDVYAGALLSALGAINAGVTTVLDWSHIQNSPAHTDAAIQSLLDSKIRAVFAYGQPSRGMVPWFEDPGHAYPDDLRRLQRGILGSRDARVTLALAAAGPEFYPIDPTIREWEIADELDLRIAVHVGIGRAGMQSRLAEFARRYPLNERTTYIHCCTLSDLEWKMIADSGGAVSLSPQVEMQMGHGMPPIQTALDHGLKPSLSVDVETSAPSDMFTQMRTAFALQRGLAHSKGLTDPNFTPKLISARDVIHFATIEGAHANGLGHRTGSLTPGKKADLQCLRTDLINVLPMNDPYGVVVSSMDTSNVDTVMINGQFVKWHGVLTGVEHASIRRMVNAARDRVFSRRANEVERGRLK